MPTNAELRYALYRCENWFKAAADGEDGVDWLNGQSEKYHGDAWRHAARLQRDIHKLLTGKPARARKPKGRSR